MSDSHNNAAALSGAVGRLGLNLLLKVDWLPLSTKWSSRIDSCLYFNASRLFFQHCCIPLHPCLILSLLYSSTGGRQVKEVRAEIIPYESPGVTERFNENDPILSHTKLHLTLIPAAQFHRLYVAPHFQQHGSRKITKLRKITRFISCGLFIGFNSPPCVLSLLYELWFEA